MNTPTFIIMIMIIIIKIKIIIIIIIIIIIKTQERRTSFQSPYCAANCCQHVRSSGQGAVVHKLRNNTLGVYYVEKVMCHVGTRGKIGN